ncbi:uncharacterized protein MJAP1_002330 [Malassezia japonica]|uniref:Ubiquinone biosynthesis protein n=1 Tax=Malassezia japonica TaxID=223818 RepID=A0AAF0JA20_9BASI|nr:uncharacterized protein MJAP1_002330 [Malassezia japonica]WFD39357.1 hypothetical protein MJAP1_002330 [Malassezia japonica]
MTGGPAAVHALLRSALPHVPSKGFSLAAIRVAVEESVLLKQKAGEETATPTNVDRALERLFPGPDTAPTSGPRRLFAAWDQEAGTQMVSDAKTAFGADPKNNHDAFQGSVELLSDRLCASAVVQPHLLPAFTLLSSEPLLPLPSLVQRLGLSPRTVPFTGSLPNPGPLLQRYAALANQACFAAGMTGHHGPEWYSLRARLATAYGAAGIFRSFGL